MSSKSVPSDFWHKPLRAPLGAQELLRVLHTSTCTARSFLSFFYTQTHH